MSNADLRNGKAQDRAKLEEDASVAVAAELLFAAAILTERAMRRVQPFVPKLAVVDGKTTMAHKLHQLSYMARQFIVDQLTGLGLIAGQKGQDASPAESTPVPESAGAGSSSAPTA